VHLREARQKGCNAFEGSGAVHRERIIAWFQKHPPETTPQTPTPAPDANSLEDDTFEDNYDIPEEAGGVGQTLKSLQADERRLKKRLDQLEAAKHLHKSEKAELVKEARRSWLSVSKTLLQYDIKVSIAKRESGELIPLADAVKGVHALLAWHTVGVSDALRNVIPELEGKNKYEIATTLDPALRSSIYRTFKMGVKLGKIPDWMGRTAAEFVKDEKPLTLEAPKPTNYLDEY